MPSRSYVELIDPDTKVNVVLLGCLHGSSSSSDDVQRIINAEPTDAVVLELCATRFADLRRQEQQEQEQEEEEEGIAGGVQPEVGPMKSESNGSSQQQQQQGGDAPPLVRFVSMIIKINQKRGLPTAIAAAILSGVSGLQTSLSGFRPGLEFRTATKAAQELDCDILLADQAVDETLRQMGRLPRVSLSMLVESVKAVVGSAFGISGNDDDDDDGNRDGASNDASDTAQVCDDAIWQSSPLHKESRALSRAIYGDPDMLRDGYQVRLSDVLTRNKDVVVDLVRLTLPIILFAQLAVVAGSTAAGFVQTGSWAVPSTDVVVLDTDSWLFANDVLSMMHPREIVSSITTLVTDLLTTASILAAGYVLLALPAVRIILTERDAYLTRGIKKACEMAAKAHSVSDDGVVNVSNSNDEVLDDKDGSVENASKGRVVAVLGLLHVNSIAMRILDGYDGD